MLKNFTLLALSCFLLVFANSCKKETTGNDTNPGGTSLYSFDGTPGTVNPGIAGFYAVGRAMDASNTVTLNVTVLKKGTYSLNTTGANGVWFFGTGIFTTTGPQTIVLTGKGTPLKKGVFHFVPVSNNTCNFSVSFLDGAPAAVFTYAGAPAACTAPVISGTYASGVALNSGNYVDLAVNVTTPGAYTVSTNPAGGIIFSGSGAFTATGAQVIRLIGNGTPSATGTFAFTPAGGCSFSITVAPPPPPASFTYTCAAPTISGTYTAGTALNSTNTIVVPVNVTTAGLYSVTTNSDNGVTFSASGVFSGTGAQSITLTSTNTPAAAGTFSYTPAGAGCSFDITYTGGGGGGPYFLTCKIDNVVSNFNDNLSGYLDNNPAPTFPYHFNAFGENSGSGDRFYILLYDNSPIAAGNTYNNGSAGNLIKFCTIQYNTGSGTYMISTTNPNSFSVTITGMTATEVTGTFSGTLYDGGVGPATKTITAGSFKVDY